LYHDLRRSGRIGVSLEVSSEIPYRALEIPAFQEYLPRYRVIRPEIGVRTEFGGFQDESLSPGLLPGFEVFQGFGAVEPRDPGRP